MLDLKVINGTLVIPGTGKVRAGVGVKDGKVVAIDAEDKLGDAARTVDAAGKYVIPGVIDPHVHLGIFTGDFGSECESETRAALAGGVTTIGVFMGGGESYLPALPGLIETVDAKSSTDLFFHLSMFTPDQLNEIPRYIDEFGVTSFKFYMCGVTGVFPNVEDDFIKQGLEKLVALGGHLTGCVHCENQDMFNADFAKVAEATPDGGLREWAGVGTAESEEDAVIRACRLATDTGARFYLVHQSSAKGVAAAKANRSATVYVETTSPYLSMDKDDACGLLAKMLPPIKDASDREALWEAVKDGTINSIGTDNVSLNREIKGADKGMLNAMPGYAVLQTHLPVLLHEGVNKRGVALEKIVELTSKNPAEIYGVYPQKGTIAVGSDADLVVVDLDKEQVVDASTMYSFSDFSLYDGRTLKGWPVMTIKGGQVVVEDGTVLSEPGIGSFIRRSK
ncbi:MAG: amidohydrolase family protein [Thermoleophilia bacterium]|nr:amidohydrolase family protein [Thermoleophilia bacterium]